ncbi:MAG: hypothetical protein KGZ39_05650 [Simkania sp.]|nr:hypothetical protein [Simkania sp.]
MHLTVDKKALCKELADHQATPEGTKLNDALTLLLSDTIEMAVSKINRKLDEEMVNDSWVIVLRYIRRIDPYNEPFNYIYCCVNAAIKQSKRTWIMQEKTRIRAVIEANPGYIPTENEEHLLKSAAQYTQMMRLKWKAKQAHSNKIGVPSSRAS